VTKLSGRARRWSCLNGHLSIQICGYVPVFRAGGAAPLLSLTYKDGERKIALDKEASVWIARPASPQDLRAGSLVTISGRKPQDSEIVVIKASIAPPNSENPPL
jgi:hypothetical protein